MASLANTTLFDDQAGTNALTFSPVTKRDGVAFWTDFGVVNPELRPVLTLSVVQVKANGTVGRVKGKISLPFLGADGTTVETGFVNFEAVIPKGMSEVNRHRLRNLAKNALNAPAVQNAVARFEDVF